MVRTDVIIGAALAAGLVGCYGTQGAGLRDAVGAWQRGDRARSLELARTEYARFLAANDLTEAEVRVAARQTREALESQPVLAPGEALAPTPEQAGEATSGDLAGRLRADLLAADVTRVVRATGVVRDLELGEHAPGLLDVVFSRRVLAAGTELLAGASPALRALTAKRLALDALEGLP